jgi:hypothetical protein
VLQLGGGDADSRQDVAAHCAALLGCRLRALEVAALPAEASEIAELATRWDRESMLGGGALFLDLGQEPRQAILQFADRVGGVVFLASEQPVQVRRPSLRFEVQRLSTMERHSLWMQALGERAHEYGAEIGSVASHFRLSARQIAGAAQALNGAPPDAGALALACRRAVPTRLIGLAQRVESRAGWDDLVLQDAQKQTLQQIVVHVRHRSEVLEGWGFAALGERGLGITALFAGDSGTGKTLAAEVLARTLHLELHRIDLASVVSKYIGETEKNLRQVFAAAEDSGAVLLFDEADALFGKRSEVRDSHDRYANIEVSYLLQQMEAYGGLAILTSNNKAALDGAFMRRLRFVVHFPFPEASEREAIWRRAFPPATPTRGLAWDKLARLQVTGGQIRNIALGAAFYAAASGEPVGMAHVLKAAYAESGKRERAISDSETRGWV